MQWNLRVLSSDNKRNMSNIRRNGRFRNWSNFMAKYVIRKYPIQTQDKTRNFRFPLANTAVLRKSVKMITSNMYF